MNSFLSPVHSRLGIGIKQGYGLSEASPVTHAQPWPEWHESIGSVGKLLPKMEAKYMTTPDDGSDPREVQTGEVGELYLRGPNIFLGYHKNPSATADSISKDGWFRTGDVGYQDFKRNFFITDRVKELIEYKGFQVAPAELRGILVGHAAVNDVAVIQLTSKMDVRKVVILTGPWNRTMEVLWMHRPVPAVCFVYPVTQPLKRIMGNR